MRIWLWLIADWPRRRLKAIASWLYNRCYGSLRDERPVLVVRCLECSGHAQILEGWYEYPSFICLCCNVVTDDVRYRLLTAREAKTQGYLLM